MKRWGGGGGGHLPLPTTCPPAPCGQPGGQPTPWSSTDAFDRARATTDAVGGGEVAEPIYAEISEIRQQQQGQNKDDGQVKKSCAAIDETNTVCAVVREEDKHSAVVVVGGGVVGGSESASRAEKSGLVYGLITAKQAAKFVPCNQTLIVRH